MNHDRVRAAAFVTSRRGQLGLTQEQLATRAGVDIKTINSLETGRRWPQATSRAAVERALDIEAGVLQAIAGGGEPPRLDDLAPGRIACPDAGDEGEPEDALLREIADAHPYLTDDDLAYLRRYWADTRRYVLARAQEWNAARREAGSRRRKGA